MISGYILSVYALVCQWCYKKLYRPKSIWYITSMKNYQKPTNAPQPRNLTWLRMPLGILFCTAAIYIMFAVIYFSNSSQGLPYYPSDIVNMISCIFIFMGGISFTFTSGNARLVTAVLFIPATLHIYSAVISLLYMSIWPYTDKLKYLIGMADIVLVIGFILSIVSLVRYRRAVRK